MRGDWTAMFEYDVGKDYFKSCAANGNDSTKYARPAANAGPRPPVKRSGSWLTSAKGGDPMSHGSVERSASFRTRHIW